MRAASLIVDNIVNTETPAVKQQFREMSIANAGAARVPTGIHVKNQKTFCVPCFRGPFPHLHPLPGHRESMPPLPGCMLSR
jgi:hypothetical protein